MRKIFFDTAGALALLNKKDLLHDKAENLLRKLNLLETEIVLTDYILVEICNSLSRRKSLAIKFLNQIYSSKNVQVVKISEDHLAQALSLYEKYIDKTWGLTDITSFVVMQSEGIQEAFTCDKHFNQFGFVTLL